MTYLYFFDEHDIFIYDAWYITTLYETFPRHMVNRVCIR